MGPREQNPTQRGVSEGRRPLSRRWRSTARVRERSCPWDLGMLSCHKRPDLRCVTFQKVFQTATHFPPASVVSAPDGLDVRMNSSYESFDFTGGWQNDMFAGAANYMDGSSTTSEHVDSLDTYCEPGNATSPDEWLFAYSPWTQQNNSYGSTTFDDAGNLRSAPMYAAIHGHTNLADLGEFSDFDRCHSQSSFSEPDFDHLTSTQHTEDPYRNNNLQSLTSRPSTNNELHQHASTSTYVTQNNIPALMSTSQQSFHPTPVPDQTRRTNIPPASDLLPTDPLHPRQQLSRWAGDLYTPTYVRGDGPTRAGWCSQCASWLTLKDSAYWYHMHFAHGISCATGGYLPHPVRRRPVAGAARGVGDVEALCAGCERWILLVTGEKGRTAWFRHAYRCLPKDGPVGKEKKRGKSASPRKVAARPVTAGAARMQ